MTITGRILVRYPGSITALLNISTEEFLAGNVVNFFINLLLGKLHDFRSLMPSSLP